MAPIHTPEVAERAPSRPRLFPTVKLVTPAMAQAWLAQAWHGQRRLRPHHVLFLRHLLRTGHWRQGSEIHFARLGKDLFLINGQHTLTALCQEQQRVWLTVIEIEAQTLNDVARLYESFDRNLARSLEDIYQSDPQIAEIGWTKKELRAASGGVAILAMGMNHIRFHYEMSLLLRDPFVRAMLLHAWRAEASALFALMQTSMRPKMARSAVFSVALVTMRFQRARALLFWEAVSQASGLTTGQPERALVHFLLEMPSRAMDTGAYARHVALAWNAAFEGRDLLGLSGARAVTNPIRLAGTPHDGTDHLYYLAPDGTSLSTPLPRAPIAKEP